MTYNLIIILLEFEFLSKCKLFTTMKELVVKGLYSAKCNFYFPRSEFPVIINIPITVEVLFTIAIGSTTSKEDLKDNTLMFLGWCSSFENFPVAQYVGNLYGEIFS